MGIPISRLFSTEDKIRMWGENKECPISSRFIQPQPDRTNRAEVFAFERMLMRVGYMEERRLTEGEVARAWADRAKDRAAPLWRARLTDLLEVLEEDIGGLDGGEVVEIGLRPIPDGVFVANVHGHAWARVVGGGAPRVDKLLSVMEAAQLHGVKLLVDHEWTVHVLTATAARRFQLESMARGLGGRVVHSGPTETPEGSVLFVLAAFGDEAAAMRFQEKVQIVGRASAPEKIKGGSLAVRRGA